MIGSALQNHERFMEEPLDEVLSHDRKLGNEDDQPPAVDLNAERDEVKEVKQIAKSETLRIRVWRYIVGFTILGAGALVSLGTYFYLDRQFEKEAEEQVRNGLTGVSLEGDAIDCNS